MASRKIKLFVLVNMLLVFSISLISNFSLTSLSVPSPIINHNYTYTSISQKLFNVPSLQYPKGVDMNFHGSGGLDIFTAEFNYSAEWIKKLIMMPSKYDMYEKAFEISQFSSRHVSLPGNNETRDLIESYLADMDLSYSEIWFPVNYSNKVYYTANVIVNISQIDSRRDTILLLAHYDSLSFDFRDKPYPEKAPGADDDLSGVVALLYFLVNMKEIEPFGFRKNVVAVFLSGEEDSYAGSKNVLSYFSNFTTIDSAIYIDEVGKSESELAIFYGDLFDLLESANRANSTLGLPIRDMKSPRDSSFVGCGESVFRKQNIPVLVLSEVNYDNIDTHTEHDTLDKLSMDKIVNATMFLAGTIIDYVVNFPQNSSIVESWKHYFEGLGVSIRNISSLRSSLRINTLFVADLPNDTLLTQLRSLNIKKIVYLSETAMRSSKVFLGQKAALVYDIKPNYTISSLKYHPLLLNTSICNAVFDYGIGFEFGHGLDLLKFTNVSLMKLTTNSKGAIEIYFTPIKPMNGLKKIFQNIMAWDAFTSYFYIVPAEEKNIAGDLVNLSIYAKNPISWNSISTTAMLTVYAPLGDIILSKELVFSEDKPLNISLYVRYPGIYQFHFEGSQGQESVIQTLSVSPAVEYYIEHSTYALQGDSLKLNVSLSNVSNKTLSLTYFVTNYKERTVNTGDFFLPPGETNMTLLSPRIWSWDNTTIELRIESQQIFVALERFLVIINPGLSVNITSVGKLGQLETKNVTINVVSFFRESGELLVNASGDFSASVSREIIPGKSQILELPLFYQPQHPYDVGEKKAVLSFYFKGHLVYRETLFITVIYSSWGFALGFMPPVLFVGLGVFLFIRRFTRFPPEVVAENKWLLNTRKYNETIYLTKKEPAKKVLDLFIEKTAMKHKKGPFFTVYYNHSMILVVKEEDTFYAVQCYSDDPKLVINTCLHFSIYAVPPRQ